MRAAVVLTTASALLLACSGAESPHGLDSGGELGLAGSGPVKNFVAPLRGEEEVPPVDTKGTGLAKFQLREGSDELDYKLIAANIVGVTQAHIHCGSPGVNGPIVVFLFGFDPAGVAPHGILAQGTITPGDVIPLPDSPECPGGIANFEELIERLQAGGAYANVHTLVNPGGEIRGHIDHGNGVD
ncbi:MAG: CHRD domain-containing protein [Gemmatimonadota bacterium]